MELQRIRRMRVRPTDLVLDVGSGNRPNARANVLCDRFPLSDAHRFGQPLVRTPDRLMVVGDITRLPFADKTFDYVVCSHVLEHVDDPAAALHELQRVGRAGYIETPSPIGERLVAYRPHKWFVRIEGDGLVLTAKTQPVADPALAAWFSALPDGVRRMIYMRPYESGLCTCYFWEGSIRYRVEGVPFQTAVEEKQGAPPAEQPKRRGTLPRLLAAYGRWLRRRSDRQIRKRGRSSLINVRSASGPRNWRERG